ncbi:GTP pyrophosphokinase [Knoellia sinensis KCTC 19936]|uniref:GTP pyrophosphokinase n=1 Tax=Knoellia sinensis KCTC 19936 TaxID=1385520 RepID=A0A0A0J591_9MICO|nr:GTP pyrophosphokinase [Knoellia sinensis]KGN32470.1 GTP pyrophosphokinase [Knoellia sinensis KCTC 19936]
MSDPEDLNSATASAPSRGDVLREAIQRYSALQPELRQVADEFVAMVTVLLDEAGINYVSVTGRAKSIASFAGKAGRTVDGEPVYVDPFSEITDTVGVRVVTYLQGDVAAVADLLAHEFSVLDDRDLGQETASEGRWGYASRHLLVTLDDEGVDPAYVHLRGRSASVQVRTILQHAWAEFEHDVRYKGSVPAADLPDLDRRFTLAAGLLELADREFTAIRDRLLSGVGAPGLESGDDDPRLSGTDLAAFLSSQFQEAGWSRTDHYTWIAGLLLELGITSLDELGGLLGTIDVDGINERMGYKYPAGAVRRLDDALLAVFGPRYIRLHGNAHRVESLTARLEKVRGSAGL